MVVAFVTHAAIHQHVRVTDHLPPVQLARLPARRHALPVDLVLGTDDLLLAALLAAGKRTVCTGTGMRKKYQWYRQQKDKLIDWIEFYAVLAIFQSRNGGQKDRRFIISGTERQCTEITGTDVKATLLQMLK